MASYIKIPRSIFNDDSLRDEKFSRREAFLDLIQMAAFQEKTVSARGRMLTIQRGQIATSVRYLAERWGWGRNKVSRVLKDFEAQQLLGHKSDNLTSIISINNYDCYQGVGDTNGESNGESNRASNEAAYNKESKERQESKEKKSTIVDEEKTNTLSSHDVVNLWNSICSRCQKVRGLSDGRADKIRARLVEMRSQGDVETVVHELFAKINASDFLCLGSGDEGHKNWRVTLDWVFANGTRWLKILEGAYDNKGDANPQQTGLCFADAKDGEPHGKDDLSQDVLDGLKMSDFKLWQQVMFRDARIAWRKANSIFGTSAESWVLV